VADPRFDQIVVGFDGTERGREALRLGELLARTTGARLSLARVCERATDADAQRLAAEVEAALGPSPVAAESLPLSGGSPARALHELAERRPGVGMIVLGSTHKAGIGRVLPGSTARRLLNGSPCAIAVAPRGYVAEDLRVIEVGFEASTQARAALEAAARIGRAAEATMKVIAIDPLPAAPPSAAQIAEGSARGPRAFDLQQELHAAVSGLPVELRALPIFEHGDPGNRLLARAAQGVDLLVVGSRGYGPLRVVLLGSVAIKIVENAPCPVLVTPRSAVHCSLVASEGGARETAE
jgi:nucleotide-binding universal stress UspA family protein